MSLRYSDSSDSHTSILGAEMSLGESLSVSRSSKFSTRAVFVVVFLFSALYMGRELKRGWVPHDEGAFAQSAQRVLFGEIPHKDFNDVYTGGLTYLNAFAFRTLGINLASMRYVLYVFFLAWVAAFFGVAVRFVSPPLSGCITLLAVAWSVPNYAAPMPSWYNLFFATFGLLAIMRYIETEHRRFLFIAGLCGGL